MKLPLILFTPATLIYPNIPFSIFYFNNFISCCYLNMRNPASQLYKRRKNYMLSTESQTFLDGRWEDKRWLKVNNIPQNESALFLHEGCCDFVSVPPLTAELKTPQWLPPINAELTPPQSLPYLLLNVHNLSIFPPITAEHMTTQCIPPITAEPTPHQCLTHLLLNLHHLRVFPTYCWT